MESLWEMLHIERSNDYCKQNGFLWNHGNLTSPVHEVWWRLFHCSFLWSPQRPCGLQRDLCVPCCGDTSSKGASLEAGKSPQGPEDSIDTSTPTWSLTKMPNRPSCVLSLDSSALESVCPSVPRNDFLGVVTGPGSVLNNHRSSAQVIWRLDWWGNQHTCLMTEHTLLLWVM